jgi:hypothetical protein
MNKTVLLKYNLSRPNFRIPDLASCTHFHWRQKLCDVHVCYLHILPSPISFSVISKGLNLEAWLQYLAAHCTALPGRLIRRPCSVKLTRFIIHDIHYLWHDMEIRYKISTCFTFSFNVSLHAVNGKGSRNEKYII